MKRRAPSREGVRGTLGSRTKRGTVGAAPGEEEKEREQVITTPLVFQCLKCKHVLGDSFRMLLLDESTRTITLSGATNVTKDSRLIFSTSGADRGSSFVNLSCRHCETVVGKSYTAAPESLANLLGAFTLHTDTMSSYQLGSYDVQDAPPPPSHDDDNDDRFSGQQMPPVRDEPGGESEKTNAQLPIQGSAEREDLYLEIAKMEGVILALHDRLVHLEDINHVTLVGLPSEDPSGSPKEGTDVSDRTRRESSGTFSTKSSRSGRRLH